MINKLKNRFKDWTYIGDPQESVVGCECLYRTCSASNGAVICPGEITQIFISRINTDGTCLLEFGDGWCCRILDRVDITDVDDIATRLFRQNVLSYKL